MSAPAYALDVSFSATASVDKVVFPQTKVVAYEVTMQNGSNPVTFGLWLEGLNRSLHYGSAELVQGKASLVDPYKDILPDPQSGFCGIGDFRNTSEVEVLLEANAKATIRFSYAASKEAPSLDSSYGVQVFASEKSSTSKGFSEVASVLPIPFEGQHFTAFQVGSNPATPEVDLRHGGIGGLPKIPSLKPKSSLDVYGTTTPEISGQTVSLFERQADSNSSFYLSQLPDLLVGQVTIDSNGQYRFPQILLEKLGMRQFYLSYGGDETHASYESCPLAVWVSEFEENHTPVAYHYSQRVDSQTVKAKIFGHSRWLHLRWQYDTVKESLDRSFLTFKVFAYERHRTSAGRSALRRVFLKRVKASQRNTGKTFRELIGLSQRLRRQIESVAITVVYSPADRTESFRSSTQPIKVKHQRS